jgi:hypothetical protein
MDIVCDMFREGWPSREDVEVALNDIVKTCDMSEDDMLKIVAVLLDVAWGESLCEIAEEVKKRTGIPKAFTRCAYKVLARHSFIDGFTGYWYCVTL